MSAAENVIWRPNDGPQTAFLAASEFEVLYGGAAGGGKSDALMFGGLRQVEIPQGRALFLRRSFPELREMIDRAHALFPSLGGIWNEQAKRWKFPSGFTYEFSFCENFASVHRYQGQEFSYIAFDEIGHMAEERIWTYLMTRCRTKSKQLVPMMRCSANPGGPGHAWLKRRFVDTCGADGAAIITDRSGLSRRFIPARVTDNPILLANNPTYVAQLETQPEMIRRQLLYGDWTAGTGIALDELSWQKHWVDPFTVPSHWRRFAAFDWGYTHPFSYGLFAVDEDRNIYLEESTSGQRLRDDEIVERIHSTLGMPRVSAVKYTVAGHDCWSDIKARTDNTPTVAQNFGRLGIPLLQANISRPQGLNNMRRYIAWKKLGTGGSDGEPRFKIMATENNRRIFECLESMVTDPNDREDALKMDADDSGMHGDDPYDMVRYALASRPLASRAPEAAKIDTTHYDQAFHTTMQKLSKKKRGQRGF